MPLDSGSESDPNVIKFPAQNKTGEFGKSVVVQLKPGSHEMTMQILHDMGFSSVEAAEAKLAELRAEKDQHMLSLVGKIKDKVFNRNQETEQIAELEEQIADLSRKVKMAHTTEPKDELSRFSKAA